MSRANVVAVLPPRFGMGFGVANEVDGFIGVNARRGHGAIYASADLDMERRVRQSWQAGRLDYAAAGQSGVAGRGVDIAVVGQQVGQSER